MDLDELERRLWLIAALGFLMVAISLFGEYRGWWNDIGEAGLTIGSVAGVLATFGAGALAATKGQVRRLGRAVVRSEGKVDGIDAKLDSMDGKLDHLDKLDKLDRLDTLDAIQFRLDAQTGVLSQQLDLLAAIRDGL